MSGQCLQHDPWLSQVLEREVYHLDSSDPAAAERALQRLVGAGRCFLYAKVPCRDLAQVWWLEGHGFRLVDTAVTLAAPLQRGLPLVSGLNIRLARPQDRTQVGEVAASSFRYSRFHADPRIGSELADRIKRQWSENFFVGARGDLMVVAADQGRVVGYNLLLRRGEDLVIDLIAVARPWRGQGVARDLIAFAQDQAPGATRLVVGTQLANRDSLALYQGLGMKLVEAAYVYHLHLP
jgi:GNAT superfamily N-acetyltransferase